MGKNLDVSFLVTYIALEVGDKIDPKRLKFLNMLTKLFI